MKRYLTKTKVAARYQNSVHTIAAWTKSGYIPFIRCGRLIRFDAVALDEWDAKRTHVGRKKLTPEVALP